nr:carboxypeptidase B-like [Vanessa tameamea]
MRWLLGIFVCVSCVYARHEQYDKSALFNVKVKDVEQINYFNSLDYPLDIWMYATQERDGIVLVPKDYVQLFQDELNSKGIEFVIEVENIKDSLELEDKLRADKARNRAMRSDNDLLVNFDDIYNLTEVNNYLKKIAEAYPDVVTLVNGGKSFEGRDMNYLKISNSKFEDASKPIIFIESLLHAREWVTLPATLYAIEKLVVNVTDQDLIDDFDWIIMPVANPDGYEFSHDGGRFWRKNRRNGLLPGDVCLGVDLNRNFDIFYSLGSSNNVCSDIYHGTSAFSEPETQVIRDILHSDDRIEIFLDIHSFGNLILYGWGSGDLPENAFALHVAGIQMATAIDEVKEDWNLNYRVGNSALVLYPASGTAMDYGLKAGVPLSYTYELPARRNSGSTIFGFLVDPDFIKPSAVQTWEGIKAGAIFLRNTRRNLA